MKFSVNKMLSVFLSLVLLVSVCICAFTTVAASKEITYYVDATGSDTASGLTVSEPLQTVSKAIEKALDGGFATGDTVYVNLVDYAAISWGTSSNYDFQLVVRANDDTLRNTIIVSSGFVFGGDTSFENIIIRNITNIYYGNHSISFDENCTFVSTNHYLGSSNVTTSENVESGQTVSFGSTVVSTNFRLSDKKSTVKTYENDVNVMFSNAKSAPTVYLTAESGKTVFGRNLNINIMNSKSVEFLASGGTVSVDGALQVMINSNTKISDESRQVLESVSAGGGFYYIINASGVDDMINATETAGKYAVNTDRYTVIATDTNGKQTIAQDGYLTLSSAGQYTVSVVKIIETATYYVGPSGSDENDGTSSNTALATISKAVELANAAGYLEGDIITVKVIRNSRLDSTGVSLGSLPKYKFNLVVESNSTSSLMQSTVNFDSGSVLANNEGQTTYYNNVKLVVSGTWVSAGFTSSNVVFDSKTTISGSYLTLSYGTSRDDGSGKTIAGQSAEVNCLAPYAICLANSSWSGRTYTEDVNLTINNSSTNTFIQFNSYWSGSKSGSTRYKKNVNLNFKSMKGVRLNHFDGAIFEGAIQIINSAGIGFDTVYESSATSTADPSINEALADVSADIYLINNETGNADIITFTETAGKYAVDTNTYRIVATDLEGVTYTSAAGYLVLENPGEYTVTLSHTHSYTDDCDEICDGCGDARTNAHTYSNVCDATCDTCGYVRTNNHSYDNSCDTTCNVCFATRSISHVYINDCDTTCDICGEERVASEHIYTYECDAICNKCGFERDVSHTYTNNCDDICDVCGEARIPDDHVYSHGCDATCNICGDIRIIEHTFSNDCDSVCNVCRFMRAVAHNYDNNCDSECNVCGNKRITTHTFDNSCDAECNVCGAVRTNIHIFDSNCDAQCNICGETRTVAEHIFDSVCDTDCAECGLVRETAHSYYNTFIANNSKHWKQCELCGLKSDVEEHIFDDDCDKKCNACGYIRSVDGHSFDNDCDTTCNKCNYVRAIVHSYSSVCDDSCDICGYIRENAGHIGGEATCKTLAVCSVCGEEYGSKSTTNHTGRIVYRNKVTVTCGKDGYGGDPICLDCNKSAGAGEVIPATGLHKYDNDCDAQCNTCGNSRTTVHYYAPATCETPEKCWICGTTNGDALEHNYVTVITKATTSKDGLSYKQCSECKNIVDEVVINRIESIKLSAEKLVYNGQVKTPYVIVKDSVGNTISSDYYSVVYANGRKDVGKYNVTVRFNTNYSIEYTLEFTVLPKATSVNAVTANGNSLEVVLNKQAEQTSGYQVQYSTKSDFTEANVKTVSDSNITSVILNGLKFDTVYYVRVRTYKVVDGQKIYSAWSDYEQIKT